MPSIQEPFKAHGFERIKKFLNDGLRVHMGAVLL